MSIVGRKQGCVSVRASMFVRAFVIPYGIFWESDCHCMSPKKRKNVGKRVFCVSPQDTPTFPAHARKSYVFCASESHFNPDECIT